MTITELYELFIHYPNITTDSRNCPKGSLFFALKGDKFDGNRYAKDALSIGASYAVIDNPDYYINERTIVVKDSLKALQQLAHHHRKVLDIPVVGITGSNGKTTTKELLAAVLSSKFNLLYTEGNLNNHIGVPLTLLKLNHEHELAVIEMGANHIGEIAELAAIAQPNFGIITNIGYAHLEGFGSFEGVLKAKGELYEYIRKTKGTIFIREEDDTLQSIAMGLNKITYGESEAAFASGQVQNCSPFLTINWRQQGEVHTTKTHLVGSYNINNLLVAIAVGRYFKIPTERINRALEAYEPTNNRSQLVKTEHNNLIIDAYNANPSSMKAALENFKAIQSDAKAIILGDMFELGEDSQQLHSELVEMIKEGGYSKVMLCGKEFSETGKAFTTFVTTEGLVEYLKENPLSGYTVLIKGSRGMGLEKVIALL